MNIHTGKPGKRRGTSAVAGSAGEPKARTRRKAVENAKANWKLGPRITTFFAVVSGAAGVCALFLMA